MQTVEVVWDDGFLGYDFGRGHPFSERSRWLAVELLRALEAEGPEGKSQISWVTNAPPADRETLASFHRPAYLDRVEALGRSGLGAPLDAGDTPSFPGCFEAASRLVGGTVAAFASALGRKQAAFAPAGGLHHAHPDRASGFCIFNDLAVGIRGVLSAHPGERVAYVDVDAHHGDGVMYGFYEEGRVLDIDFHQDGRTIFPGTGFPRETGRGAGRGLKVNVPLPPGTGDEGFRRLFRRIVPPLIREFRPSVLVLQCGVDGHSGDRLGATSLELTPESYREVVEALAALAAELGGRPMIVTGGGGYSAENVSRVLARVPLWLLGRAPPTEAPLPEGWRQQFEQFTGWPGPTDWAVEADPVPWRPQFEEKLVRELEAELGRRFPAPADASQST